MPTETTTAATTGPLADRLRATRSALMLLELEAVALRLFCERSFGEVTVETIAEQARISARTFYRYFPAKEDVLQAQIDRRAAAVRASLAARPPEEPLLRALRLGVVEAIGSEDLARTRQWTDAVAKNPELVRSVMGGIIFKTQRAVAEFAASRLGIAADDLGPTVLAAATQAVVQTAQTQWYVKGGDFVTLVSDGIAVLERGIGSGRWDIEATDP